VDRIVLLHISDLHIGSELLGTRVATWGFWTGLNGHGSLYCDLLQTAIRTIRLHDFPLGAGERLHFVCSGDLTRIGSTNDFHLAYGFLLERWGLPDLQQRRAVGLQIPTADLHSVAGNHDHWNGYPGGLRPPAYSASIYPRFLQVSPWVHPIWCPGQTMALELFGIDSNRGKGLAPTNLRAGGRLLPGDVNDLQQKLHDSQEQQKKDRKPRLRAIVCHHALTSTGHLGAQPLDPQSVASLLQLAHQYDVAAILTGHTHTFEEQDYVDAQTGHRTWELRSASTTQMDPQPDLQGFWVHLLENHAGRPTWRAYRYQLDAYRSGFLQRQYPVIVR
jgi:hypothetical protein